MGAENAESDRLEDALRRIEADETGLDRRTVVHEESTLADMVETLETIREHGATALGIDAELEPFESLAVVFEVDGADVEVELPGEVVQFSGGDPILQFEFSEQTGVQIDRAVDALTHRGGSSVSTVEGFAVEEKDEDDDRDEGDSIAETNPFVRGASDTLGGQQRRSGPRTAVDEGDRSDAPFMRESTGTDGSEVSEISEASDVSGISEASDVSDVSEISEVSEASERSPEEWPSEREESERRQEAASSVVEALEESSEPGAAGLASQTLTEPELVAPEWWQSQFTEGESERLEAADVDGALAAAGAFGEPGIVILEGALDAARVLIEGPEVYAINFDPPRKQRTLGWLLRRSDKISESALRQAREAAAERECSVPAALIHENLLPRGIVEAGRRARLRELLPEIRKRQLVEARFRPFERLPDELSHESLSMRAFLFERIYEPTMAMEGEELEATRERFAGQRIMPDAVEEFSTDGSPLDEREARFVDSVFEAPKTFEQLLRETTLYEHDAIRLIAALEKLGWVAVGDWDEETKTDKRMAQKLVRLKTRLEGAHRFEQLDIHWTAHQSDLEEEYADLEETFEELEGVFESESREAEVLADLRKEAEAHFEFLSDQSRRREYRREIKSKFQIRSALQLHEEQLDQARMQRDVAAVRDHCRRLLELDPGHREAAALLEKLAEVENDE